MRSMVDMFVWLDGASTGSSAVSGSGRAGLAHLLSKMHHFVQRYRSHVRAKAQLQSALRLILILNLQL